MHTIQGVNCHLTEDQIGDSPLRCNKLFCTSCISTNESKCDLQCSSTVFQSTSEAKGLPPKRLQR